MSSHSVSLLSNAHVQVGEVRDPEGEVASVSFQISVRPVASVVDPEPIYRLNEARFQALTANVAAASEFSNSAGCDPLPGCSDRLTQCALKCGESVITRCLPYGKLICGAVITCATLLAAFTIIAVYAEN